MSLLNLHNQIVLRDETHPNAYVVTLSREGYAGYESSYCKQMVIVVPDLLQLRWSWYIFDRSWKHLPKFRTGYCKLMRFSNEVIRSLGILQICLPIRAWNNAVSANQRWMVSLSKDILHEVPVSDKV